MEATSDLPAHRTETGNEQRTIILHFCTADLLNEYILHQQCLIRVPFQWILLPARMRFS